MEASALLGIFLDTETNGLNFKKHVPIEIAIEIRNLSNGSLVVRYDSIIRITDLEFEESSLESLAFTGISYEQLQQGKPASQVRDELLTLFYEHEIVRKKALFICQNPSFDRIFFSKLIDPDTQEERGFPYNWLDLASMYWARCVFEQIPMKSISLSKDQIAKQFGIPPEEKPHRAFNGVKHLIQCYEKVVGFQSCNLAHS